MPFLLEKAGTANAVKTAVGAVTGSNATETTMLGIAIKMVIDQINAIGAQYFYVRFAGVYQAGTAQRLDTIVEPLQYVDSGGNYSTSSPPGPA